MNHWRRASANVSAHLWAKRHENLVLRFGLTDVPLSTDMLGRISAGEGSLSEFRGIGE